MVQFNARQSSSPKPDSSYATYIQLLQLKFCQLSVASQFVPLKFNTFLLCNQTSLIQLEMSQSQYYFLSDLVQILGFFLNKIVKNNF